MIVHDTTHTGRLERWLFPLFAAIVLLLGGLSVYVWQSGLAIKADMEELAKRDLARLVKIGAFKSDFLGQSLAMQRLYATADSDAFDAAVGRRQKRIRDSMVTLHAECPHCPELTRLEDSQAGIEVHGAQLAVVMRTAPVDWDAARVHLYAADSEAMAADALLGHLAARVETRVEASRRMVESTVQRLIWSVLASAVVILTISGFFGYYTWRNVVVARMRRRLAQFPERNPLPVFSLSPSGELLYANPAAHALAVRLHGSSDQVAKLLPAQAWDELPRLAHRSDGHVDWEYIVGRATLHCGLHCMADLGVCHAYVRDITEQRQAERQLHHQAMHDAVTGLPNQRAFQEQLDVTLAKHGRGAVLLLHLDRFRGVIETLGHGAGELVLRVVGERLAALVATDTGVCCVHRFESEMFGILLNHDHADGDAPRLAGRIAAAMQAPLALEDRSLFFTFSIGAAVFPEDGTDRTNLLRLADTALHQVMGSGGNGFRRYDAEMDRCALERMETEHELRHAEQRGELELHYQPQVALDSGRIVGLEALVRWRHPSKGLISPAEFIPLAEETGMIGPMGEWILATACARNRAWQMAGLPPVVVAVNISPRQFIDRGLPGLVRRVLAETGLAPEWLELEVTEGAAMQDLVQAEAALSEFKAIGVHLSIDDFGTGHSSLAYLSRFPIDKLKVDQSFVRNLDRDAGDAAIARSVVALGHALGLTVIAEGVETVAQLDRLREFGCQEIQGYLFSKPVAETMVSALLAAPPVDSAGWSAR